MTEQKTLEEKPKFQNLTREELIIRRIFDDSSIQSKIISHMKPEMFEDPANKMIVGAILKVYKKYKKFPQSQDLNILLGENSLERKKLVKIMGYTVSHIDSIMAIDVIESFFKEKKTEKVLLNAAESISERDFENIGSLVSELEKAVSFSLHMDIGIDLVEDVGEALTKLNKTHIPIPSAIADIRAWTNEDRCSGGWYRGSLSVFVGMPNIGKTLQLCNEAAYAYMKGYNVLYITMELVSEVIWEKIAVNVTGIPMSQIRKKTEGEIQEPLKKNTMKREAVIRNAVEMHKANKAPTCGTLLVRQMPSTTTAIDIENLMNEVEIAKGIKIDVIYLDYLQKMKPARNDSSIHNASLYTQGKEVAEQVRDLALKYEIPIVTASQLNRDGYSNKQADMANTAGSAAINDTADLMVTITDDPYLKKNHLFMHMIIKNRFGPNMIAFISHCDWTLMRVRSANTEIVSQYRESMLNQTVDFPTYNDDKNQTTTPSKAGEAKEKDRFESIRMELEAKERESKSIVNEKGDVPEKEPDRFEGIRKALEKKREETDDKEKEEIEEIKEESSTEETPKSVDRWEQIKRGKDGIQE